MLNVYRDQRTKTCSLKEIKNVWKRRNLKNFVKYSYSSKKSVKLLKLLSQALPVGLTIDDCLTVAVISHEQHPGKDFHTGRATDCPSFPRTEGFSAAWDFQSRAK